MFDSTQIKKGTGGYDRILFIGLLMTLSIALLTTIAAGQGTTAPADQNVYWGGYTVNATVEFGWRFRSLTGNENKYRSDLNYAKGFRTFDTNVLLQSESGKGKYFDSLLVSNSGWGSDPQGFTRFNIEKIGIYKFNANVRKISYFNNLSNHALGEHTTDTRNLTGDFDLSILPQNEKLRFNLGASFSDYSGPGMTTTRAYSDEFGVNSFIRNKAYDYRAGVEGQLAGFDLSLAQGFRIFQDRSAYSISGLNLGNNPTNNARFETFSRIFPTNGDTYYTTFNAHRTFAKKLDFTGKFVYVFTKSNMAMNEVESGRDNSNNIIDADVYTVTGRSSRYQKRGDIGLTYMATDKFRISNTFTYDTFSINGGNAFQEAVTRRTAAGGPLASQLTQTGAYRVNDYTRYLNLIEGDYQFNNAISLHFGYRYTHRKINVTGYNATYTSAPSSTNPEFIEETESNHTNTVIAGMKIKPVKNWVIFWDIERGDADNVFTRLENYKFTNFRVRSRLTLKTIGFNFSAITKDNSNPSFSIVAPTAPDLTTNIKTRMFSGSVDWNPMSILSVSGGYNYTHLTSYTPIIVPAGGYFNGFSQFFARDHYAFLDVSVKPVKRVSLYGSYRISRDLGQGNRFSTVVQNIIGSYPMQFQSPEFRAAFQITKNIDWNIGYQYYDYKDSQNPTLNYRAHLPYTSIRIYFGNGAADR